MRNRNNREISRAVYKDCYQVQHRVWGGGANPINVSVNQCNLWSWIKHHVLIVFDLMWGVGGATGDCTFGPCLPG